MRALMHSLCFSVLKQCSCAGSAKMRCSLRLLLVALLAASHAFAAAEDITVVDLTNVKSVPDQVAVQVCVGLFNRNPASAGAAYTVQSSYDREWLADTDGIVDPRLTPPVAFLRKCLNGTLAQDSANPSARSTDGATVKAAAADVGPGDRVGAVAKGVVRYNYTRQQGILPLLITIASVLDAVPIEENSPLAAGLPVVFDATKTLAGLSYVDATAFVFDNFGARTSALAFLNPVCSLTLALFPSGVLGL